MIENLYKKFLECKSISTDTRQITAGSMFFCLKGENFNANKFTADALEKGARIVILDEPEFLVDDRTILVDNVLKTLQQLARFHRDQFHIPVIGITGTNGKTTSKELISTVLSSKLKCHFTKGNLNNHIGVPLTLLSMPLDTEIAVIEMGANHLGDIKELCEISNPNFGIITNIGKAHLEGFGSIEGVIKTKTELYDHIKLNSGTLFVNADDDLLNSKSSGFERLNFSNKGIAEINVKLVSSKPFIKVEFGGEMIQTNLLGSYNLTNITAAIAIGHYFKIDKALIKKSLENYQPSNKRSQFVETTKNKIYLDAYNANPTSMRAACQSFVDIDFGDKIMVLGDMLELGIESKNEHLQLLVDMKKIFDGQVYLVGPEFHSQNEGFGFTSFEETSDAVEYFKKQDISGKFILVKGSRGIHLEDILSFL